MRLNFTELPEDLTLNVRIKIPNFGIWRWRDDDFEKPLVFNFRKQKIELYLDNDYCQRKFRAVDSAKMVVKYKPVPISVVRGLFGFRKEEVKLAETIYRNYLFVFNEIDILMRTIGGATSLEIEKPQKIEEFFYNYDSNIYKKNNVNFYNSRVYWHCNGYVCQDKLFPEHADEGSFMPMVFVNKKRDQLYTGSQLITAKKWEAVAKEVQSGYKVDDSVVGLVRNLSKLKRGQNRTAAFESAVIIESVLKQYIERYLLKNGFSKNKIKKQNLKFDTMLNVFIPLIFKKDFYKIKLTSAQVDVLRDLRNKIAHGDIVSDEEVKYIDVAKGIGGAIKLVEFLNDNPAQLKYGT